MTIPTKSAVALVLVTRGLLLGTVLLAGCSKPNTFIGQWWADGTENGVPFHADMHIRGNGEVTRRVELGQLTRCGFVPSDSSDYRSPVVARYAALVDSIFPARGPAEDIGPGDSS